MDASLEFPIHYHVPPHEQQQLVENARNRYHFPYGSWVEITTKDAGPYVGEVGVVFTDNNGELASQDLRLVLLVPREYLLPRKPGDYHQSVAPLGLITRADCKKYSSLTKTHPQVLCKHQCSDAATCDHDDEVKTTIIGDEKIWVQCGLRMIQRHLSQLAPASSISNEAAKLFLESNHPALREESILSQIPPPPSWHFFENDKVIIISDAAKAWGHLLGTISLLGGVEREGIIQQVETLSCAVLVDGKLETISKTRLRRQLAVGMNVAMFSGASEGYNPRSKGVVQRFDAFTTTILTSEGISQEIPRADLPTELASGLAIEVPSNLIDRVFFETRYGLVTHIDWTTWRATIMIDVDNIVRGIH